MSSITFRPMNHKKRIAFQEFEDQRKESHLKFLKIFPVRWAATLIQCVSRIVRKYTTLISHLELIHQNLHKEWAPTQAEKANKLSEELTDENFMVLLYFQLDVLGLLATQSLVMQKTASTHIGGYNRQQVLLKKIKDLPKLQSKMLVEFLTEAKCAKNARELKTHLDSFQTKNVIDIESCGTLEKYENSQFKSFKGIRLWTRPNSPFEPLSSYLESYVQRLEAYHDKYMLKDPNLIYFDEFDQRLWKNVEPNDGESIVKLGEIFNIDNYQSLDTVWIGFKKDLMDSIFYKLHKNDNPNVFWPAFLQSAQFRIDGYLEKLIKIVLAIPPSSADAERMFSIMNHIR